MTNMLSLVQDLAQAFGGLPQVLAVVLAGSHADAEDPGADSGLCVYAVREVPAEFRRTLLGEGAEIGDRLPELGDAWNDAGSGARIGITYRSPEWLERQLDGIGSQAEQLPGPAACLRQDVLDSEALFDPRGWYAALQERLKTGDCEGAARTPVARVEHAALWVADLERARAFYERWFGAAAGPQYVSASHPFCSRFLTLGSGARLELMSAPGAKPGFAHIAISLGSREAVDALVDAMRAAGVKIASGPKRTGDGYYEAVAEDPEGNPVEITA